MRRRLARIAAAALLSLTLVLPSVGPATAATGPVVLAVEGGGSDQGPEPLGPDASENEFAPPDYEANFLVGAGVGMLVLFLLAVAAIALGYWLRVARPRQRSG